jgi:hypothetical protein
MLLFVDQSSAHNAYATDALNARKMNITPAGKQPIMHNTRIPVDNPNPDLQGQIQTMVFPSTHPEHPNKPKGMEQILRERGLWDSLTRHVGRENSTWRFSTSLGRESRDAGASASARSRKTEQVLCEESPGYSAFKRPYSRRFRPVFSHLEGYLQPECSKKAARCELSDHITHPKLMPV